MAYEPHDWKVNEDITADLMNHIENRKISTADITDASTVGKNVLKATDADTARNAIGAGTSSIKVGTAATDAKAGNYAPASSDISDATATGKALLKATDAAAARSAIGAGTPYTLPTATATVVGGVKKAAHVDRTTGSVADIVDALVAAGIMADA